MAWEGACTQRRTCYPLLVKGDSASSQCTGDTRNRIEEGGTDWR